MNGVQELTDQYNVVYTAPGRSDRSAMPLGNGRTGISLWVEEDGALQFYIGHTDAQSELDRNLKLGKVILELEPNPFRVGGAFRQELFLREGCIEITASGDGNQVRIKALVDAEDDTLYVSVDSSLALRATARLYSWRTAERAPWPVPDLTNGGILTESADVIEPRQDGVLFYHKNGSTCLKSTAAIEGLADHLDQIVDTLTDRTFGGYLTLRGGVSDERPGTLRTAAQTRHELTVSVFCEQQPDTSELLRRVIARHQGLPGISVAAERTARFWDGYFGQSYLFVSGDPEVAPRVSDDVKRAATEPVETLPAPSKVTQAYILTRFMFACAGLGKMPLAFNGLIFNLMPALDRHLAFEHFGQSFAAQPAGQPTLEINPDEKGWEECCTLWQNVRLPYASMLARGETAPVRALFAYYRNFWEINRVKARLYYQAEGQYNTEITHSFGLMPVRIYGVDRAGLKDGYAVNRWGGAIDISPGLELCFLMLDYVQFSGDTAFLQDELLPYAHELLRYVETRFTHREEGKIVLSPLQSVETYFDTTNPVTVVAGMHAVLDRILELDAGLVAQRPFFERLKALTPDLPLEKDRFGSPIIAPASVYTPTRHNVESPALYTLFPFRLFGLDKPQLQLAKDTFRECLAVSGCGQPFELGTPPGTVGYAGWQYVGMAAAYLGLADECADLVAQNCALRNPGTRFPAMWGPIHDAVPDVDHGANILTTLQLMAFQPDGQRLHILPAWPKEWDVTFKLYVTDKVSIECVYRGGQVERLVVDPPEQAQGFDIVLHGDVRGDAPA